ncbi:hypothetical protein [Ornithinimicrobium sp. INDO-MA30-4]|uniref:hypothetical protein n=1 Tax=Ornithinimicrobium sp. INDO-MA30-4 TaxID=2908651 RepID=UPI001F2AC923|nr:hypothetical protein [Ornithinimicrobium sp. INDO-MA30-4]UJH71732.1 hypothetical protein L0A91_16745 [Ornithinimicrobium sp. INDO-MA30-4]
MLLFVQQVGLLTWVTARRTATHVPRIYLDQEVEDPIDHLIPLMSQQESSDSDKAESDFLEDACSTVSRSVLADLGLRIV